LDLSYSSSARLAIGEPSQPVRLIRDFVNTAEPQLGTDQLVPLTAAERLERLGLVTPDARLAATDLPLLVGVREGLREVLLDHADHDVQGPALNELDDLLHCRRDRCNCFLRLFAQPLRALVLDGRLREHSQDAPGLSR
jgi:hypothetical protein